MMHSLSPNNKTVNRGAIVSPGSPFAIMGIVNVTPDSFYDGGKHWTADDAVRHGLQLRDEGADILDIGGASSRPGAAAVDRDEERRRILPVIERLAREFEGPISVDTTWADVAADALDAGAAWINDISAGRFDPKMVSVAAQRKCPVVLMHSRGTPETMQQNPIYNDVVTEVKDELLLSLKRFTDAGLDNEKIILDPGIGFAKTFEHNIALLRGLHQIVQCGYPVLIGTSRKSFIGKITGKSVNDRLFGTLGTLASAFIRGVKIFRVHDVAATRDFLSVLAAIESV
jgi:dihydropteroate synthase